MNGMAKPYRPFLGPILALWFFPALAVAAGVQPRFDLTSPGGGPFPSDRFMVLDPHQATFRRVDLPKPDCAARPSDCEDIDVMNTLDGFNLQPRLGIPFDGPIDVASVDGGNVFLLRLASTMPEANPGSARVGVNQVVWDPATMTLFAEADEFLDEHTVYGLIVTREVLDAAGDPIEPSSAFRRFVHSGHAGDPILKAYRIALRLLIARARQAGVVEKQIAVASVFTTQSATSLLRKIQRQIKRRPAPVADFGLGPDGSEWRFGTERS